MQQKDKLNTIKNIEIIKQILNYKTVNTIIYKNLYEKKFQWDLN